MALDVPTQIIDGSTMVPLRFVAENSGFQISYTNANGTMTIQRGGRRQSKAFSRADGREG
ncbi:copper amine oxidase N-terminal domain-containing protein [Paenibacillus sp. LHD-38]|nr:copper amine oxidase N-terminal domain-containing protein [Paenibacillus sp. LHD-38]MDQ8736477.1 copper amine oxidase N-terminal domain-containing protein [Paenibacillus sp. LHD-38]